MGSRMRLSGLLAELLSLLVVIGANPRRPLWSKGREGWGLNVQQFYQMGGEKEARRGFSRRELIPFTQHQQQQQVNLRKDLSGLSITNNLEVLRERLLREIGRRRQVENYQENLVRLLG